MTAEATVTNLPPLPLPQGITSNQVECPSVGLSFHVIEAGYHAARSKPLVLLLHGYPELAFSWRKVMLPIVSAGYYVVAPDQRGYGRTTGWDNSSWESTDMSQFNSTTLVRDIVVLINALGYTEVNCVIGHDFGAVSASMCALMRPDIFKNLILMSHPYKAIPKVPFNNAHGAQTSDAPPTDIQAELADLAEPRKHYRYYNSTKTAATDWSNPPQGLSTFLRGYAHVKSADWAGNKPYPLYAWTGKELAKMPHYYIMPLHSTMPQVIQDMMQAEDASKTTTWLPDSDLAVYVQEWERTGFQGGLNWYRARTDLKSMLDLQLFAGRSIDVPTLFISGAQDWGNYQEPGALDSMSKTCTKFQGVRLVDGAGHWPQQEQPENVVQEILDYLGSA